MEMLQWKIRVAVLWIVSAVAMSAHTILINADEAVMKKITEWAAQASAAEWLFTALFWLVPLWMAYVAVTMKDSSANRWVTFVVAVISTIVNFGHFFTCCVPLLPGSYRTPTPHHMLLVASTAVATGLVAWHAWKWPQREVQREELMSRSAGA